MAVEKYLPEILPATYKGHMKRQRKCIRTTKDKLKEKLEVIRTEKEIHLPVERDKMNQIFTSISTVDKKEGTIYVNNTGDFPIRSIDRYIAIFVLYNWKKCILATPIKDTKD